MKQDFTIWRNQILQNPQNISPLKFGMSQDEVIEIFGKPDAVSTMRSDGKPLILKYHEIELHFDSKAPHGLYLIYSDDEIECFPDVFALIERDLRQCKFDSAAMKTVEALDGKL